MFCKECGQPITDGTRFCPACGTCQMASEGSGVADTPSTYGQARPTGAMLAIESEVSMKWHKFLIYFYLFWMALNFFIAAYFSISGGLRVLSATSNDGLDPTGIGVATALFGIGYVMMGMLCFVTWQELIRFKRSGVHFLLATFVIHMLLEVGYVWLILHNLKSFLEDSDLYDYICIGGVAYIVGTIGSSLFLFFAHKRYYGKRAYMFAD